MTKLYKSRTINSISLVDLSKVFRDAQNELKVLDTVIYRFHKGVSYALMGASGTGKSTLLHLIAYFDEPTSGMVLYDDSNIGQCIKKQKQVYLRDNFGILFQNAYLLDELSVLENVMLKGLGQGRSKAACHIQALMLLETLGISDKIDALPAELSGGQQQRVALARALFDEPDFLLADEPTGNLDEATGTRVIDMVLSNQKRFGMGMIISTHDMCVAERMDVILELRNGKLYQIKGNTRV